MMKLFSIVLLAALCASNAYADGSGNRQCPGGYSHGSQMEVGRYWYECKDGQMMPKGCLAEDGHRVDLDATYDTKNFRMQCVLGSDGFLTVTYKACMLEGSSHDVGSQWDDGTTFYNCVQEGNNLRVNTLGCVDQGRPLKLEERVAKGDFLYQCKKASDGTPRMNKVGCVHEGRKYTIGETFDGPKAWYTCTDNGAKVVGCMYESHEMKDGDYFDKDGITYACKVTDTAEFVPFSCKANINGASIAKKIGCFWNEGDFEYTCKPEGKDLIRAQTSCIYRESGRGFKIEPGCAKVAGTIAVGCKQSGSQLSMETYPADQIDRLPGLRQC